MKLYEINEAILQLTDKLDIDPDTGELLCDADEVFNEINALQMERKAILEYLAKVILNIRAESAALKNEEERLKERRARLASKENRLMQILDRECAGEKTNLGVATFSYRKSNRLEVSDAVKAIDWLKQNNHTECYRVPAPEVAKIEVKKLINAGAEIPGCNVVQDYNCLLK